jgi:acyl-CoA-binding protein
MALEAQFKETADNFSKEINQTLSNDELKEIYALFKQVCCADAVACTPVVDRAR